MKVSVKGSKDGGWGLTQKYKKENVSYHEAIDGWLLKHSKKTIFSLVQFINTDLTVMPRVYLATPNEIAQLMKSTRDGKGDTVLREDKIWTNNMYKPDMIPKDWLFSLTRLKQLSNRG